MKTIELVWLIVQLAAYLLAQSDFVFPVDTLVKTGLISKRINICLLPDGYQASEMTKFRSDANCLSIRFRVQLLLPSTKRI